MKRAIKTASAILLALAMTTPAFAAPTDTDTTTDTPIATPTAAPSTSTRFTDINSEEFAWAKSYINDMAGKGFISGYEDNTFRPDNDVTRLEAEQWGQMILPILNYWKSHTISSTVL